MQKRIVRDLIELNKVLSSFNGVFSFDVETTGLNPEKDEIVGFSISNGEVGVYVPLSHKVGVNADKVLLDLMVEYLLKAKLVLIWNKGFDLNFLYYLYPEHFDVCFNVLDMMVVYYDYDSDSDSVSLKSASERLLKVKQVKFMELLGDSENFSYMYPEDIYDYACDDAIYTYKIYEYLRGFILENKGLVKLDNYVSEIVRVISRQKYFLDYELLCKLEYDIVRSLNEIKLKIFNYIGYEFVLDSPTQVASALLSKGVRLTERTEKGAFKTSLDILESLKSEYPILQLFIDYSELSTVYSNYIKKLKGYAESQGYIRINYFHAKVPTGRIASGSGGGDKSGYYSKINIQSISKPESGVYYIVRDSSSVTGWSFDVLSERPVGVDYYEVESCGREEIRSCFIPSSSSRVIVSIDYKSQELRIATNYSCEPLWVEAFKTGEDLHSRTAKILFNSVDKNHRKIAKIVNFAILYGGGPHMLSKSLNLPYQEVEVIYNKFFSEHKVLSRWISSVQAQARVSDIKTYFGRIRRTKKLFKEAGVDMGKVAFCKRTAVNTLIQGTGADMLRIALSKVFEYYLRNRDKFRIMFLVHDEIVYEVEKDFLHEFVKNVVSLMEFREFLIPIECDISIGNNWGQLVPYIYNRDTGELIPNGLYNRC